MAKRVDIEHTDDPTEVPVVTLPSDDSVTPTAEAVVEVPEVEAEPAPLPVDPNETDLGHSAIDTRSGEAVLATRGNIVSDGPGTVGHA
jgi:hypothetical protein